MVFCDFVAQLYIYTYSMETIDIKGSMHMLYSIVGIYKPLPVKYL